MPEMGTLRRGQFSRFQSDKAPGILTPGRRKPLQAPHRHYGQARWENGRLIIGQASHLAPQPPTIMTRIAVFACLLHLTVATCIAAVPVSYLYPFPGYDLELVRAKAGAENLPNSRDLAEAWKLYGEVQNSWMPGAKKPDAAVVSRIEQMRKELEAQPVPAWFADALQSRALGTVSSQMADNIGDAVFKRQKATPDYQARKTLAILYLAEHELDRPEAVQKAGVYLTVLSVTHPWDWEIHNLYSRLLLDAQLNQPAWNAAKLGLFLNPQPTVGDLRYFAFVGGIADKNDWPEIRQAIRDAAPVPLVADQAIGEIARLFGPKVNLFIVPPKKDKAR